MSAEHIEGRLVVVPHPGSEMFYVAMQDIRFAQSLTESAARRMAACWNACEGIATEVIEKKRPVWWAAERVLIDPAERTEADLVAARTLLSDALETFDDNPHQDHEVADRIRAFLSGEATNG